MQNTVTETKNGYTRMLTLSPPWDRRHPDPNKNYGIHGMDLRMVLCKNKQAVHFVAYLPVYLPHVSAELHRKNNCYNPFEGMGCDVGYHANSPQWEGQIASDGCAYTEGVCYCDGSALRAKEWYKVFLEDGVDAIWQMLEQEYVERFEQEAANA